MHQIITAVANNAGQVVKAQAYWAKPGNAPARILVKAGQTVVFHVDGAPQNGGIPMWGKRPVLHKVGTDLAVKADGKPLALLVDFFVARGVCLHGHEWALGSAHDLAGGAQGVHALGLAHMCQDDADQGDAVAPSGNAAEAVASVCLSGTNLVSLSAGQSLLSILGALDKGRDGGSPCGAVALDCPTRRQHHHHQRSNPQLI